MNRSSAMVMRSFLRLGPNANDHLPRAPRGCVEGHDRVVEARDGADVRAKSSVPHPLDDRVQLGTIRLDNEVDRAAVAGPRLDGANDRHQRSSASNQARGPLPDLAAEDVEYEIDSADVFERVVLEIHKLLRAEVERLLTVGSAAGADDVGAEFSGKLRDN